MMTQDEIDKLFTYHQPTENSIKALQAIRTYAKVFAETLNNMVPDSADKSAAIRLLRECVMTANAGIVLNQDHQFAQQHPIQSSENK